MKPVRSLPVLALLGVGCAHAPAVVVAHNALPLQRVVIYRNGVGYFERRGHVQNDEVEFRVRQSEVGDFLATLAVMERGGSSVRSAAFPLPADASGGEQSSPAPHASDDRRSVRLQLDGRGHDLVVGYMTETPIWRPSYRLIFGDHTTQIQAWGIVQNLSGEDWSDVRLSLVAGAPVSFRSQLADPVISERPLVTDRGEVIDAVPQTETSLAQDQQPGANAPAAAPAAEPVPETIAPAGAAAATGATSEAGGERRGGAHASTRSAARLYRERADEMPVASAPQPAAPPPPPPTSAPRNIASLAAVAVQGGVSRYDLPNAVTVPDHSATMVMLAAREVPGESVYLFAPDPNVPDSASHPFHVARFVNRTGAMLERGPIAIFDSGSFLGQGMLDPLPDGASAIVPFALERALAVETQETDAVEASRLVRIARNDITIERYRVQRERFHVRNGMDHEIRVVVRQTVPSDAQTFHPPEGTEMSDGAALVPVHTPARGQADAELVLRTPFAVTTDWNDEQAAEAIRGYLAEGHPAPALAQTLQNALDLRQQLQDLTMQRADLDQRLADLRQNAEETRENLLTIARNRGAADLRRRLTQRMAQLGTEIDALTRHEVEMDTAIGEKRVRLSEGVREIQLDLSTPAPQGHT